ncbi:ABC transporter substrate-binding protein [Actinomadura xylanilytica]|uniref:ABC transporter substrate-binding protein n=1 Tax=Actinomadura xylanilytica TaxID=887459 RepID=UPI00255B217A|nr:ABC transporter substrate-binding protein [Actinomadura xylanilytica]MDL4777046.1 ABC transporter substrate-binding protein [Actinomadura xylanilytica]
MTAGRRGAAVGAGFGVVVLGLAACGGGGGGGGNGNGNGGGGTLKVVGSADVDHLDTSSGYTTVSSVLTRNYARTLFSFKGSDNFDESIKVRPDVASEIPSTGNGGLSADGKTYTIKLRNGVQWNTNPAREVMAADFVRGIKRVCNPAKPSGGKAYYSETIVGMAAFCKGYAKVDAKSASALAAYQNDTAVAGLQAKDDKTLIIRLNRPATDLTNILGMQFAAAAPAEYDKYIPDSPDFRKHTISDGPYQITSYTPNKEYILDKNPTWRQDTDDLRAQNPNRIQITMGQDSPDVVQQQMEQGTADLSWDQTVPTSRIPTLKSNSNFKIMDGSTNNPYLVFNTLSPNNGGALGKPAVRQAIEYAIDKTALIQIYGGPDVSEPLNQVIPPRSVGHEKFDLYPTSGNGGDPAKCKQLLTAAGYGGGLTLKFPYRTNSNHSKIAQSVQANLKSCGITANPTPDTNGTFYNTTLVTPADAKAGKWDIAAPGWIPDWYGNNGRTNIVPLFDGRQYGPNSTDYGGYDDPQVNALIDQALAAKDVAAAAPLWARADRRIMQDAAVVPFMNQKYPIFHSSRVKNALYLPSYQAYDLSQVKLS